MQSELIGSLEASDILSVSHATFNRWAKQGRVPVAIKAPGETGLRLFNRADIERLVARKPDGSRAYTLEDSLENAS